VRSGATRAAGSAQQAARGVVREFAAAIAHEINQQFTAGGNYLRVAKRAAEESPPNVKSAAEASAEAITQVDRTGALNPGDHCQPAPQWFYSLVSTSSLQKTGILLTIGRDFWECHVPKFDKRKIRDFAHREKPAIGGPL
jgi:hypothetical protein